MNNIKNLAPGTRFHFFGVDYEMVRVTGEVVDMPKRNQWGRSIGGTYKADKVVVKVNKGPRRGWSLPHYTAFPLDTKVIVLDGDCHVESCAWKYGK